jgi:hypothetical protein
LVSADLLLAPPDGTADPELVIDLGFGTDEGSALGVFHDSFSLTLQSPSGRATALLLTADSTGLQVAPPTSGGLDVSPQDVHLRPIASGDLLGGYALTMAFSLVFPVPRQLLEGGVHLFVDLFDNQDALRSLGFVRNWHLLDPTAVNTNTPPQFVELEVAASVEGGYARESHAVNHPEQRRLTLDRATETRFFRARAEVPVRVSAPRLAGSEWVFNYSLQGVSLVLRSAPDNVSPFADEPAAAIDTVRREARVAKPAGTRVYKLQGNVPTVILSIEATGNQLLIRFEYRPKELVIESSTLVEGPYGREAFSGVDFAAQQVRIPRFGVGRFYRLVSDQRLRILRTTIDGDLIHFDY